ncbi:serine/threonine-protein kinase [Streptomyces sp. enrichment culture]|uniref:serine/threonine-protein kinase n=1 Tax=Streptomyces sp. enrichment culture TaxID=1795815 RepID=UPI003F57B591
MAPQSNTGVGAEAELPEYAGHYLLESCLGSGGMGVVHLARSTSGMQVAVKVVHAEFARDPEFRGRFRQEVAAARRVSGAFTAPVVDADPECERPWMATLFIPGPTLSEHVKRNGPMDAEQLRRLMAGLAEALRDIHRVGVVHRDLKPSNVLLAHDGPKVIDFGISRPKDSELRTETGKLIGTPPFMAPEQFRRPREVGPAADVFALGSVMVHAATGRGPFDSDSPYVVAYQVVHDEPDLSGVPAGLVPLISRCLAKDPEERPTPDELMRELRSLAASYDTQAFIPTQRTGGVSGPSKAPSPVPEAGSPAQAKPLAEPESPSEATSPSEAESPSEPESPSDRPARRRWGRRGYVAAAAGLLTAVTAVAVGWASVDGPSDAEAGRPAASDTGRRWQAGPVVKDGGTPQCSYGGKMLLCGGQGVVLGLDPSDGAVLWRRPVGKSSRSAPPVLSGGVVQPMAEGGDRLTGLDPSSGEVRWRRDMPTYQAVQPAGDMLLFTGADGTVTGVDGASGRTRWSQVMPGQSPPYFVSFAGDPLAYSTSVSDDGVSTVAAVVPETGEVRWEARLEGVLKPVGSHRGSLFFLAVDQLSGDTVAVVRHTPATGVTRRVELPVPRAAARAGVRGDVVHIMAAGGSLEAVDLGTGRRAWVLETSVSRGSAPVADGRHVYVTAPDGRLLAVDARSGRLVGQTPPRVGPASGRVPAYLPEPVLAGDRVVASAPDGTVFSVPAGDPAAW